MTVTGDWQARERRVRAAQEEARDLPREPVSRWVWVVVAVATIAWLAVLVWQTLTLPETVPQHWGSSDVPDRWAGKTEALAFTVAMPLVFAYPMPLLARMVVAMPDGINGPNKEYWTATGPRLRRFERLLREDLWLFAAWMIVLLVVVGIHIGIAAHRPGGALSFLPAGTICGAMTIGLLAYVGWMYKARYREDPAL